MTKKTFASFEQQIQHLEDKVIIISDRAYAEAMLKQIGYFPLIGGYKHLFRVPFTKTYKIGTTFEEIVALYEFDSDLRDLFFKYLLQIERNLRSLMSYYFTEKYGESQDAYLDSSNYNTNRRNQKVVSQETRQNYTKDRRTKVQQTQTVQKNQQTTEKTRNLVMKKGQKKK